MKRIVIAVEVPNDHELMASSVSAYSTKQGVIVNKHLCRYTVIERPSEDEIELIIQPLARISTAPDKDTPIWMLDDIRGGYKLALEQIFGEE